MNKQIKKLWLKALRSGEYKQTTGQLKSDDAFCCLGVLCDIHAKKTGEGRWTGETYRVGKTSSADILPPAIRRWAGLKDKKGSIWGGTDDLAELNGYGADFDLIAAIIETDL